MATAHPPAPITAAPRPLAKKRGRPGDRAFFCVVLLALLLALGALVWLMVSILIAGLPALDWGFLSDKTSSSASRAGFNSALRGTLILMLITILIALPLGFASAIYLEKFAGVDTELARRRLRASIAVLEAERANGSGSAVRLAWLRIRLVRLWLVPRVTKLIEVNISNLAAVPSIIYGLLGLAAFVAVLSINKSLLAGGLTLAVLVLPIIIIASREAIKAVPVSIEQGAMALGATRWQAVRRQVLPVAFPGMLTGTILAMSRAIGESAPLIVVGGIVFGTQVPSINPLDANDTPLFAMPLQIFFWAGDPRASFRELAAAGIIVLLATLILLNSIAILLRNRFTRRF